MNSSTHTQRSLRIARTSGRAPVIAVALLLALGAVALAWFTLGPNSPPPSTLADREITPAAEGTDPVEPLDAAEEPVAAEDSSASPEAGATVAAPSPEGPGPLTGRVVGTDGLPIADARVRLLEEPAWNTITILWNDELLLVPNDPDDTDGTTGTEVWADRIAAAPSTTTDEGGVYTIARRTDRPFGSALLVSAPGYGPVLEPADDATSPRSDAARSDAGDHGEPALRTIILELGTLITGSVTSSVDGRAAVGAEVVAMAGDRTRFAAMTPSFGEGLHARVGDDGRYGMMLTEAGRFRIGARSGLGSFAPLHPDRWSAIVVETGDTVHTVDLVVDPGGSLDGRIVDAGGRPVGGAKVGVIPDLKMTEFTQGTAYGALDPRRFRAEADGTFRVDGLPFGRAYRVMAEHPDFARGNVVSEEITAEFPHASVTVALARGSTLSGFVETPEGAPAAAVEVTIIPDISRMMEEGFGAAMNVGIDPVESGPDGAFRIEHVPGGRFRLLAGELDPLDMNPFGNSDAEYQEVDGRTDLEGIILVAEVAGSSPRGDLSGLVVDTHDVPLPGVKVTVSDYSVLQRGPDETEGAADGEGAAIPEQSVVILTTDAAGRFEAPGYASDGVQVRAQLAGYSEEFDALDAGQTEIVFRLEPVATIRGRVVLLDGSVPPVPFRVRAVPLGEDSVQSLQARMNTMLDPDGSGVPGAPDGTFALTSVPLGTVEVVVRAAGFAPSRSRAIELVAGSEVDGLELVLTRGATLHGRVVDPDGEPLPGAKVIRIAAGETSEFDDLMSQLMPAFFDSGEVIVSGSDGSYRIEHLAAGTYRLRASHERFARSEPVEVTVRAEGDGKAPDIALLLGGIIEGRIARDGEPQAGMMVQVFSAKTMQQVISDDEGIFRIENLPDGEYGLTIIDAQRMFSGGGGGMRTRTVEAVSGTTTTLEIAFGTGATVSGTIDGLPDRPMNMITLRRPGGPAPEDLDPLDMTAGVEAARYQAGMAMVGPDGAFAMEDIEPGEYILEIPAMPDDPTDVEAYQTMDRTPVHRRTIQVGESDMTVRIVIRP